MTLSGRPSLRTARIVRWALLILTVAIPPAIASQMRRLNLEEMSHRAGRILSGTCTGVRLEHDPSLNLDVTVVSFAVKRSVKGPHQRTVTFRIPGSNRAEAGGTDFIGMPVFTPGEDLVLFLYAESAAGLTSPVGLGQGRFRIETDKAGRRLALNGETNEALLHGLTPGAAKRLGPSGETWSKGHGVPPETLLDMAQALAK